MIWSSARGIGEGSPNDKAPKTELSIFYCPALDWRFALGNV